MNATFYMGQPPSKAGKHHPTPCEYVRIEVGDGNIADRVATGEDRQRYRAAYAAFTAKQQAKAPNPPRLVKKG